MEKNLQVIKKSALFKGIKDDSLPGLLKILDVRKKSYPKGSFVFYAGDNIDSISIVLSGTVHIVQEDFWGNRNILARIPAGEMFGEAFACAPGSKTEVDAVVTTAAEIMFLDIQKILRAGSHPNAEYGRLSANLIAVTAYKNIFLTKKIRYISQRTTRQKLMAFLSGEAKRHGKPSFSIDFNRQQLADFLSVDRSAMSSELGRMKSEGLIDFNKEKFVLKPGSTPE